ncbi:unnamed protein product [Angiostrongylus costaricensis]|uniref:Glycosyltransferase family 92 protein n=1 Tax=Angiostrongylus costaricensis TaxID=334426 RepID=A0A3P7HKF7_ANGCS|nr:unnamed protein product [Angiostrongylus costaricensis]
MLLQSRICQKRSEKKKSRAIFHAHDIAELYVFFLIHVALQRILRGSQRFLNRFNSSYPSSTKAFVATERSLSTAPLKNAKRSQLIQRSVLLRYADTDPLIIFSAHGHYDYITVILSSYGYLMRRLFCRLFDEQLRELIPAFETRVFPEFIVRCPASDSARFVAVSLNPDDKIVIGDMHDIEQPRIGSEAFFSVCLAPLWGSAPKWLMLIEFIEYYRLQGAEYFYIYKHDCDNITQSILDSYEKEGTVEVVEIADVTNCVGRHRCRHQIQLQVG